MADINNRPDIDVKTVVKNVKSNKLWWLNIFLVVVSILVYAYSNFKFKGMLLMISFLFLTVIIMFKYIK